MKNGESRIKEEGGAQTYVLAGLDAAEVASRRVVGSIGSSEATSFFPQILRISF